MDELVNLTAFAKILGVSRQMLWKLKDGERPGPTFPSPVYIGGKETLWKKEDVEQYAEARRQYLEASPRRENGRNMKKGPRSGE